MEIFLDMFRKYNISCATFSTTEYFVSAISITAGFLSAVLSARYCRHGHYGSLDVGNFAEILLN